MFGRLWARYREFVVYCLIGGSGVTLDCAVFAALTAGAGWRGLRLCVGACALPLAFVLVGALVYFPLVALGWGAERAGWPVSGGLCYNAERFIGGFAAWIGRFGW